MISPMQTTCMTPDTRCSMAGCDVPCTLGHLLSSCSKSLDRYKFRHDSVLTYLLDSIVRNKKEGVTVYADLNGWRVNGGTVPADHALTEQIPDMVFIKENYKSLEIL